MHQEDLQPWIDRLFERKRQIEIERMGLLREFQEEFPPQRGAKGGYMLVGVDCGKKRQGCRECPHSLRWRWYWRPKIKVFWGKQRLTRLPAKFWQSKRTERVTERFKYYEEEVLRLNKVWKETQNRIKGIHQAALSAVKFLEKG